MLDSRVDTVREATSRVRYLNFDLTIEPAAEAYSARVTDSPAGQASVDFKSPFSDLELEVFLLRVGRTRRAVRRIDSPEAAAAKTFGGKLFRQVFTGDVLGCLRGSLDEATRNDMGLRLRLHLTRAGALADMPWEFLFHDGLNRFLGLSIETPIVRYLDFPERIQPLLVTPPLRVLLMVSSPHDFPPLDVGAECARITTALADLERRGLVVVDRHEHPTLYNLQRLLRSRSHYHVFHFMGHGSFDQRADDGALLFEDDNGRGRRVSGQDLGTLLRDHRSLRLAILNACEGARASRTDPFAGTAQSLVQQGIPAVIAMQFEVSDAAAICFAHEFYDAIATNYPVDAALAEARKAIHSRVSPIEWGTPVLYMRSSDGRIFDVGSLEKVVAASEEVVGALETAPTAKSVPPPALEPPEVKPPEHASPSVRPRSLLRRALLLYWPSAPARVLHVVFFFLLGVLVTGIIGSIADRNDPDRVGSLIALGILGGVTLALRWVAVRLDPGHSPVAAKVDQPRPRAKLWTARALFAWAILSMPMSISAPFMEEPEPLAAETLRVWLPIVAGFLAYSILLAVCSRGWMHALSAPADDHRQASVTGWREWALLYVPTEPAGWIATMGFAFGVLGVLWVILAVDAAPETVEEAVMPPLACGWLALLIVPARGWASRFRPFVPSSPPSPPALLQQNKSREQRDLILTAMGASALILWAIVRFSSMPR